MDESNFRNFIQHALSKKDCSLPYTVTSWKINQSLQMRLAARLVSKSSTQNRILQCTVSARVSSHSSETPKCWKENGSVLKFPGHANKEHKPSQSVQILHENSWRWLGGKGLTERTSPLEPSNLTPPFVFSSQNILSMFKWSAFNSPAAYTAVTQRIVDLPFCSIYCLLPAAALTLAYRWNQT